MLNIDTIATTISYKCHVLNAPSCVDTIVDDNSTNILYALMSYDERTLYTQTVELNELTSTDQLHKCYTFSWINSSHMEAERSLTIDADCTIDELSSLLHTIEDDFC